MDPLPGDVILYPVTGQSGWTSRFVAAGELIIGVGHTFEQYSHVAILDEDPHYEFEAKFPKTGRFRVDTSRIYEIWNIGNPSSAQRARVLAWCRDHEDEWYNMLGLLTGGLLGLPRTAVCSQFVGKAYAAANIKFSAEGKHILSPNAIRDYKDATMIQRYVPKKVRYV